MAARQDAATVPPKAADALAASLASGQNVAATLKTFAAAAGLDGVASGGFGEVLGRALSTGQDMSGALGSAQQTVSTAMALSAETVKGVKSDGLIAALASGQNVQQAVQSLGGSGGAFNAALGQALADGRAPGQALATARQTADTVQQNAQGSEVPVSAENKSLADLANPATLTHLLVTGSIAATANLISLMSLSTELSGWMRGEVLDTPFLIFCLSLLVFFAFSKRFVGLVLTTGFSALADVRRRFLQTVALGNHAGILDMQAQRAFDLGNHQLERIAALLPNLSIASNIILVAVMVGVWYVREAQRTRALLGEAKESEVRMLRGFFRAGRRQRRDQAGQGPAR